MTKGFIRRELPPLPQNDQEELGLFNIHSHTKRKLQTEETTKSIAVDEVIQLLLETVEQKNK